MNNIKMRLFIRYIALLSALLLMFLLNSSISMAQEREQQSLQQPLKEVIGIDGSIMPGTDGSFDASGYEMTYGVDGEPVFSPSEFDGTGFWSALGSGSNNTVYAIAVSGNDVYVGGQFTTAGGNPASRIAKWDGTSWSALGSGVNSFVFAIAVNGNDVYAGGFFTTAGGNPANFIAKWDGASWSPLGSGLNGGVSALSVSGNDVYAGGTFTTAGGDSANSIAKWDGTSWSPLGSGFDNQVFAIAVSGNDVYAGGAFFTAGGSPARFIAKWDGTNWSPLGSGLDSWARTIAVNGDDVYAGGSFTTAGGSPANRIAKWDGTSWSPLGSGMIDEVHTIVLSGNDVYAGGTFFAAGGISANRIAKWNGSSWSALGSGMNGRVYAISTNGNDVYAGGEFTTAGGNPASKTAKWNIILLPSAPHSLDSGIPQLGSIQLNWADISSNEDGFVIEKSVTSQSNWSVLDTVNANTTSFLDTGLITGEHYYYRVYAYNPAGNSDYSNVTYEFMRVPLPPHSLALTIPDTGIVRLTWSDSSNNEAGFVLERRDNTDTSWTVRDTVSANVTQFNDSNLITGRTYEWRVYAYNELGNSSYSNVVSSLITSVTHSGSIPGEYALHQNYPNPFNPSTTISFDLPKEGSVTLKIYDIAGREVANIFNGERLEPGITAYTFDASSLASGIYFYSLIVDNNIVGIKRMILIK